MKSLFENKKGILGLDTVKAVLLALMVLAVLVIAMFAVLLPLRASVESIDSATIRIVNESSVKTVNTTGVDLAGAFYRNPSCTAVQCVNASDGAIIPSVNYTLTSGCNIKTSMTEPVNQFNNTIWKCTYDLTYDGNGTNQIVETMIAAPSKFFNQTPTFFILLGIVVLILIISIVIVAVTRFQSPELGSFGGGSGENSYTGGLSNI